jgi:uncharacterized protein involved in tellurium resistance
MLRTQCVMQVCEARLLKVEDRKKILTLTQIQNGEEQIIIKKIQNYLYTKG